MKGYGSTLDIQVLMSQYEKYSITTHERETVNDILLYNNRSTIDDFVAMEDQLIVNSYHRRVKNVLLERIVNLKPLKPKTCDCGAKHTSFPKHHYSWCGIH